MKIFLTIAILFINIYAATYNELNIHGAHVGEFYQHLCAFAQCPTEQDPDLIPYRNLEKDHITGLKIAILGISNYDQIPDFFTKEKAISLPLKEIQLQLHLQAMEIIGGNDPHFVAIRNAANHSLEILLTVIDQEKPQTYQAKAMQQWEKGWNAAITSIEQLRTKITEKLSELNPTNNLLKCMRW